MKKLSEFLSPENVLIELEGTDAESVIKELAGTFKNINKDVIVERVLHRESMDSTAIGHGIAFPHARIETGKGLMIAVGKSGKGIDFSAFDGNPVSLVFLVVWQPSTPILFTQLFSSLIKSFRKQDFRNKILSAGDKKEMVEILSAIKIKIIEEAEAEIVCTASILRKLQELERKRVVLKRKSPKLEKEIETLRSDVNNDYLNRFDRLIKRCGTAIVDVIDGVCQGCYMNLSTGLTNQIKYKNHVYICENCGRFIALKED
ncbi:MAG: PTS sugar transporter subunit IIA [bacterium]|nr:PTS sugar transporter subunit IIA [bacterium]